MVSSERGHLYTSTTTLPPEHSNPTHDQPLPPDVPSDKPRSPVPNVALESDLCYNVRSTQSDHETGSLCSTVPDRFEGCLFCQGQHYTSFCERMESLKTRLNYIIRQGRCIRCLGRHLSIDCQRAKKCSHGNSKLHHLAVCYLNEIVNQGLKSNYAHFLDGRFQ